MGRAKICLVLAFVALHLGAAESGAFCGCGGIDCTDLDFIVALLIVVAYVVMYARIGCPWCVVASRRIEGMI